jgi:hypothetical protein
MGKDRYLKILFVIHCMKQSEKIIFRLKPSLKTFVKEYAEKMDMDISEFMRMVLEYYYLAMFSQTGSYKEIRKKFFDMFPPEKKKDKTKNKQ